MSSPKMKWMEKKKKKKEPVLGVLAREAEIRGE